MRLTMYTDYALRMLIQLGLQPDNRLVTIGEIATSFGISKNHLTKVAQQLSVGGYVEAVRGNGGGLRLAMSPAEINVGDVVRMTEKDFSLVGCFEEGGRCQIDSACMLRPALATALSAFFAALDKFTLQDLLVTRPLLNAALYPESGQGRPLHGDVPLLP
ncbi:MAG: RrF2 family transcriptional regulator [Minwuia sp.]|uniref:RrF2 family transcriptional regulator n=1 Tax=Minwuia sp. TaxID=2493630 RepID=UPI003A89FBBD